MFISWLDADKQHEVCKVSIRHNSISSIDSPDIADTLRSISTVWRLNVTKMLAYWASKTNNIITLLLFYLQELSVTDDTVLEEHNVDPALVQIKLLDTDGKYNI